MTISQKVFTEYMSELLGYFKRPDTLFIKSIWYNFLNEKMTTEEFTRVVEKIVLTKEVMPTSQEFLDIVENLRFKRLSE